MRKLFSTPILFVIACVFAGAFVRVRAMHNFSDLGGLIGIVSGIVYIVSQRQKKTSLECVNQDLSREA
jgi:hypothetical protein